jgi:transposase-like protein
MMPPLQQKVLGVLVASAEPLARADVEVRLGLAAGAANRPLASLARAGLVVAEDRPRTDSVAGPAVVRVWTATASGKAAIVAQATAKEALASIGAVKTRAEALAAFARLRDAGAAPAAIVEALASVVPAQTVTRWIRRGAPDAEKSYSRDERAETPTATTPETKSKADTRRQLGEREVEGIILRAAATIEIEPSSRLPNPVPADAPARTAYHAGADRPRRALLVRLLREEADRIRHDQACGWRGA